MGMYLFASPRCVYESARAPYRRVCHYAPIVGKVPRALLSKSSLCAGAHAKLFFCDCDVEILFHSLVKSFGSLRARQNFALALQPKLFFSDLIFKLCCAMEL